MKRFSTNVSGFTLIEFLIYSVIVAFMMSALVLSSANMMQARTRVNIAQEVNHNARIAMNTILNAIRDAESVVEINPNYLILANKISSSDPIIFETVDGVLTMKEGVQSAISITADTVRVKELNFIDVSFLEGETVRIILTLEYNNTSQRAEYDFESKFYVSENIRK